MNAAIVLSLHGSLRGIIDKAGGNVKQVSELLLIRKYSGKFDRVFVFSHDSESFEKLMPPNCSHVKLRNRLFYLLFGWFVLLFFSFRHGFSVIRLVGAASLPTLFITGWLVRAKIVLKYYYLWYNTAARGLKRFVIRLLERFLLAPVDYVIPANSEVERFAGSDRSIPGAREGILTDQFDPGKVKGNASVKKLGGTKVVFVGRLTDVKDPLTLIRAYMAAKKDVPGLRLIVCGDGELRKDCEKLAGADKDVVFMGFVDRVASVLKASDIYAITSLYDASPRSLMEAMCMGLPTIATNVGGVPEYLTKDSGVLVKPREFKEIAQGIVKLAKDKRAGSAMGKRARERVLKYYDLGRNLDIELEFISGAMS